MKTLMMLLIIQGFAGFAQAEQWECDSVGLYYSSPTPQSVTVTGKPAPTQDEASMNSQQSCADEHLIQCQIDSCRKISN